MKNNFNNKISNKRPTLLGMILLLTISSCGKEQVIKNDHASLNTQYLLVDDHLNLTYPEPDAIPTLKYTAISSIFSHPSEITEGENTEEILLKLRSIASLTKESHQELLNILKDAPSIDLPHLMVITNSIYFPSQTYDRMRVILNDPRSCGTLTPVACKVKLGQVTTNVKSAIEFGTFLNQVLIIGQEKLTSLESKEAYSLLDKCFPGQVSTQFLFNETLKRVPIIISEEKLAFVQLAVTKLALSAAGELAASWFTNDSDKTSSSLLFVASKIPLSETRDQVLVLGLENFSEMTAVEAHQIASLSTNPYSLIKLSLNKILDLNGTNLSRLASHGKTPTEQEEIIISGLSKIKSISTSEATLLLAKTNNNKTQMAKRLLSMIPDLQAKDLVTIVKNATYGKDREEIIANNLIRFATMTAGEVRLISEIAQDKLNVVLTSLPKIDSMTSKDLASVVESINLGTERDVALTAGLKFVQTVDIASISSLLKLAYNTKVTTTTSLLSKLPSLSASELALISKECLSTTTRDQILLSGASYISTASNEGAIAVIGLTTSEKVNIALALIPKIPNISTSDLGIILKSIADGKTRDQLITRGLPLLKVYESNGAAVIVDRSFENKFETATKLLSLIPGVSGTDLDKILAVCGSGNTRDLILGNGIKLLNQLTKAEARALYSRAYDNKDSVAVLLISKIDHIDGETIGEIARFSNKGSTRDLIIEEGLKRLPKIDAIGLIVMIQTSYKLTEKLALEVSNRIENFSLNNAFDIAKVITSKELRDRFLIHSIDLIKELDEPMITMLALRATSREAKVEIVRKGVLKIGNSI